MSERGFKRRNPVLNRKNSLSKPTPSLRRQTTVLRRSNTPLKPVKIFQRCNSEPTLNSVKLTLGDNNNNNTDVNLNETQVLKPEDGFFRPKTCMEIITTPPMSPRCFDMYNKDAKVIVTVTVEESLWPVKMMVKLGWSVEETIRFVVEKYYKEEGRTPTLDRDSASSSFHLHRSCFCLHSIDKKLTIAEVGTRSFYLRKSNDNDESNLKSDGLTTPTATPPPLHPMVTSQVVLMRNSTFTTVVASPTPFFSLDFIAQSIHDFLREILKLSKLLGCVQ